MGPSRPVGSWGRPPNESLPKVEFGGVVFKQYDGEGSYYRAQVQDGKWVYLHREVWEELVGPIPAGFEIHHRFDDDRDTIDPSRLECISRKEHKSRHPSFAERRDPIKHKAAVRASRSKQIRTYICEACGKTFERYGSNALLRCDECYYESRQCSECGASFEVQFQSGRTTCSLSCAQRKRRKAEKTG